MKCRHLCFLLVLFKKYITKTYNLSVPSEAAQYSEDMKTITTGLERRTHVLFNRDRQFEKGSWLALVEWGEFELQEEGIKPVPDHNI